MSDAAWTILAQTIVAVLGGGVIVAVIHSLLNPKVRAETLIAEHQRHHDLIHRAIQGDSAPVENPRAALERSAFAPIEDAVREGEERAVREWGQR